MTIAFIVCECFYAKEKYAPYSLRTRNIDPFGNGTTTFRKSVSGTDQWRSDRAAFAVNEARYVIQRFSSAGARRQ